MDASPKCLHFHSVFGGKWLYNRIGWHPLGLAPPANLFIFCFHFRVFCQSFGRTNSPYLGRPKLLWISCSFWQLFLKIVSQGPVLFLDPWLFKILPFFKKGQKEAFLEIIDNFHRWHGLECDCNQEATLVRGARPPHTSIKIPFYF